MSLPPLARRFAVLAILLWASGALAQPTSLGAQLDRARAIADSAARGLPGMALAASVDGETVWAEGYGYADIEGKVPAAPRTRFRIGSISKPMTAVAVTQLVETGRLDVDRPVQAYVPTFPAKRWPITTRQVGGHLAGIRHYRQGEFMMNRRFETVGEAITVFAADTLLHEPGTAYAYSSYGWNLISAVVEGASGVPFLEYMDRHVFGPLGMTETLPDWNDRDDAARAIPYVTWNGQFVNAPVVDNSVKWAGGGFLSTPEDLLHLGAYVLSDTLGASTRELLFTEQTTASGAGTGYGFGWVLREDARGRATIGHNGGSMGGTSSLLVVPEGRLVIAVASNVSGADLGWVRRVASLLADASRE